MRTVYTGTVESFLHDGEKIPFMLAGYENAFEAPDSVMERSEFRAWTNSLRCMEKVLSRPEIPADCGVMIEYQLPSTGNRIDFVLTGNNGAGEPNLIIVELKQWSVVKVSSGLDHMVRAEVGNGAVDDTSHPCLQAQRYRNYLNEMLGLRDNLKIRTSSCAYMHNYPRREKDEPLAAAPNDALVADTPLFGRFDQDKIVRFVADRVGNGDGTEILKKVRKAKEAPSKKLVDKITGLFSLSAPEHFILLDNQELALQRILCTERSLKKGSRHVVIVDGGPGTGKSVVAMTAMVELLKRHRNNKNLRNIRFISPTFSYKTAMVKRLCSGIKRNSKNSLLESVQDVKYLFCGSTAFFEENRLLKEKGKDPVHYRALIVDEAHRLHNGLQNMYFGVSQVEDIIEAAQLSVFFIDDNQALRPGDIGSVDAIKAAARKFGAQVSDVRLAAQFRCAGADGFINWLGDVLDLNGGTPSANSDGFDFGSYDFDIVDTPEEIVQFVREKNALAGDEMEQGTIAGARMLAGYAWRWTKDKSINAHGQIKDIVMGDIKLAWNNLAASYNWAIDPATRGEVGCVYTCQGLEFEYVGVFIGLDLRYDEEAGMLRADKDHYFDVGGVIGLPGKTKQEKEAALLPYLCRCYRVLLSRGVKGARVYCCDPALGRFLKSRLQQARQALISP